MSLNQSVIQTPAASEFEAVENESQLVPPGGSLLDLSEAFDPSTTRLEREEFRSALASQEIVGIQPAGDYEAIEISLVNGTVLHPKIGHPDLLSIEPLASEVTIVGGSSAELAVELTFTDGKVRFQDYPMVVGDPLIVNVFPVSDESAEQEELVQAPKY